MTIRCGVCKLPAEKLDAVNAALRRGDVSLQDVAERSGITKSSLHRHKAHMAPALVVIPAPAEPSVKPEVLRPAAPLSTEVLAAGAPGAACADMLAPGPPAPAASKARFLERIEMLWGESLDGLEASKEPVTLSKADGSCVTISAGDLRARAAFVREARSVLELQGEATGDLVKGQASNVIGGVMIVCPASAPNASEAPTVTIGVRR